MSPCRRPGCQILRAPRVFQGRGVICTNGAGASWCHGGTLDVPRSDPARAVPSPRRGPRPVSPELLGPFRPRSSPGVRPTRSIPEEPGRLLCAFGRRGHRRAGCPGDLRVPDPSGSIRAAHARPRRGNRQCSRAGRGGSGSRCRLIFAAISRAVDPSVRCPPSNVREWHRHLHVIGSRYRPVEEIHHYVEDWKKFSGSVEEVDQCSSSSTT